MLEKKAISTLLYSASYLPGVFTLGYRLRDILQSTGRSNNIDLVLVVTKNVYENELSSRSKEILNTLFTNIIQIEPLKFQDYAKVKNAKNLNLLHRPELAYALIKIKLWELIQYKNILYLDADTLPLNNDFLSIFNFTEIQSVWDIVAAPDVGWPDMFNSGVFSLRPDHEVARQLSNFVWQNTSIDGADQGILNQFFNPHCNATNGTSRNWIRLPFIYNMTIPNTGYQYTPALNYFKPDVKLVHFIGNNKPWKSWSPSIQNNNNKDSYVNQWNDIYYNFQLSNNLIKNYENSLIQTFIAPNVEENISENQDDSFSNHSNDTVDVNQIDIQHLTIEQPLSTLPEITDEEIEHNSYGDSLYSFVKNVYKENDYHPDESVKRYWGEHSNTLGDRNISLLSSHPFDQSWKSPLDFNSDQYSSNDNYNNDNNSNSNIHKVPYGVLPTPTELATPLNNEQLGQVKKIFDWEQTDYLNKVERYFPDNEFEDSQQPNIERNTWEVLGGSTTRVFPGDENFINPDNISNSMIKMKNSLSEENSRSSAPTPEDISELEEEYEFVYPHGAPKEKISGIERALHYDHDNDDSNYVIHPRKNQNTLPKNFKIPPMYINDDDEDSLEVRKADFQIHPDYPIKKVIQKKPSQEIKEEHSITKGEKPQEEDKSIKKHHHHHHNKHHHSNKDKDKKHYGHHKHHKKDDNDKTHVDHNDEHHVKPNHNHRRHRRSKTVSKGSTDDANKGHDPSPQPDTTQKETTSHHKKSHHSKHTKHSKHKDKKTPENKNEQKTQDNQNVIKKEVVEETAQIEPKRRKSIILEQVDRALSTAIPIKKHSNQSLYKEWQDNSPPTTPSKKTTNESNKVERVFPMND